jgi:hypothetical protein
MNVHFYSNMGVLLMVGAYCYWAFDLVECVRI